MNSSTLVNGLLIIALLVWVASRQLTWRPVATASMWRLPVILGVIGVVILGQSASKITSFDFAILSIELVISLGVGAVMGRMARFRPATKEQREDPKAPAEFQTRTGWVGMMLWLVIIAVRVGLDVWAGSEGSVVATSTGVILIMVAANRLSRVAVIGARVTRLTPVAA